MEFAAKVGEALLSASVQILLDRISSRELRDFMKNRKLNVLLLDEMKITLLMLGAVLNDAEEKQITCPAVKEWLEELKDAIYDAEDLLDEINTQYLRCRVEQDSQNVANKVKSFFSSSFGEFHWGLNTKLEKTSRRLEHFAKQKDILGLQSVSLRAHKSPTTSLVNESVVVGREDDKEKLMDMLLCDEDPKGNPIGVITIWGMGGVGKTTLVQLLYNDSKVQEHFDIKAWACVSNDFSVLEVTKNLVESITSKVYDSKNLDFLRVTLRNTLRNKKFFIVLDDLWNKKYSDWDDLITPFHSGKEGSKIIVTTRQQGVAEITHTFPLYQLSCLSYDNCWNLLSKHAFGNEDPNKYIELEAIGRQIVRKCGGLPIAAKMIGGLLRSKVDTKDWNKILNSNQWDMSNDDVVLPPLRLSYLYLPSHLKKCFAYCSIFPKGLVLEKKKLVLLWMAESAVHQQFHGEKAFEIEVEDYFDELLSRSFFQQYGGDPRKFVMHDLINDLAKFISGKSCVQFEGNQVPKSARHLSFPPKVYGGLKECENFYHLKCLRTLLPTNEFEGKTSYCYLYKRVLRKMLAKLKGLRVLSLVGYCNISKVPNSIGNLQHLRYLNLSETSIRRLPDGAFTLYNLQTLLLSNCKFFDQLPGKIEKLINLRHLDISGTAIQEMPTQITKLQNLQSLSTYMVGKQSDGLGIKELKRLPYLRGKLSILNLQNVDDPMDASEEILKSVKIEELVLEWGWDVEDSQNVLNMLEPSTDLKRLTINRYGGTSFPDWVGHLYLRNVTFLCVSDCSNCILLPPFGELPSLKELLIIGMALVQRLGREFYRCKAKCSSFQPFPSLEILTFVNMPIWEEWILFKSESTKCPFPRLKHLSLHDCPMLRGDMPDILPSLTKISLSGCKQLKAESSALQWITSIEILEIEEVEQGLLQTLVHSPIDSLKFLQITKCDGLQSLPRMIAGSHCLEELHLTNIPSITSFPVDGLPTSLQFLTIQNCKNLEFLPQNSWQNYTSLENLGIWNTCPSLKSFPLGCFPKLKGLAIHSCYNLETITYVGGSALPLEELFVEQCQKLTSMSEVPIDSLPNLKRFHLNSAPKLESLPQGGLPSNLERVTLEGWVSSVAIQLWGFQRLTSLLFFQVESYGPESIVPSLLKNQLLPISLVVLVIIGIYDLKMIEGKGLQHLTSLQQLSISRCPNLESLPEDELPSSLLYLQITNCPKLEERYKRGKPLAKIAYIPTIQMNEKIYDR